MKEKLISIINEFGSLLTKEENYQYIPKLRDYLIPYIIETKGDNIDIDTIFKDEFTRSDIIKATMYYITENENVESLSAIDDYLIALNRLFDELLFNKYPNPTLMKYKPFTKLSNEIQENLKKQGVELKGRETNPTIDRDQFKFIIDYLKNHKKSSIKFNQVSIMIKLFLLYGFSHDKVSKLKLEDYNANQKTLKIQYKRIMKRNIFIELPYSLAQEINEYLKMRNEEKKLNSNLLFVSRENTKVSNGFIADTLDKIKEEYIKINGTSSNKNQFTPTGIQKYAIIQMILNGMNQSVIMDFTGQQLDIYNDCQNEVNRIKELDRNRYINHMIRGINTYDEI